MKKMTSFQWVVTIICTFLLFFNRLFPTFAGLNQAAVSVLSIFIGTLGMLILVDLTWPPLLMILAFPVSGLYTMNQTLQMTIGHNVVCFIMFNGILLYVLKECGLLRRAAITLMTLPISKKSAWAFISMMWITVYVMACIIDITANVILFSILIIEICNELGIKKGSALGQILLFGNCAFSSLGYACTPLGHSNSMLAITMFADLHEISILSYTLFGVVFGAICLVIFICVFKFIIRPDVSALQNFDADALRATLPPMSKAEKYSLIIFVGVVAIWLSPDFLKGFPAVHALVSQMSYVGAPALALIIMCLLRTDGKPLLNIADGAREGVSWPAVLSMAAAMMLGTAINNPDAAIPAFISAKLGGVLSAMSPLVFVFILGMITEIMTQFTSCTVTLTTTGSVALAMLNSGMVSGVNVGAFALVMGITSGIAYMTASAGTAATVTLGYEWVSSGYLFKKGGIFAMLFGALCCVGLYSVASMIL